MGQLNAAWRANGFELQSPEPFGGAEDPELGGGAKDMLRRGDRPACYFDNTASLAYSCLNLWSAPANSIVRPNSAVLQEVAYFIAT